MGKYINPIISGFNPDPSICRKGDVYYLATSSFEYFPGVPIYKSTNLVNWDLVCNSLYTNKSLDLNKCGHMSGVYAPTLRYDNGVFYMITTNSSGPGHLYVTTKDIESGIWSDATFIEGRGFDPDLFFDDDGKVYFTRQDFGGFGIHSWEIDLASGKLVGEEYVIWDSFEDRLCEAPHIYKINGLYYLLVAEGGTYRGHMCVIARSHNVFGPYEGCPHNPILTHRNIVQHPIQSCGHGDLINSPDGNWWIVFLATRPNGNFHHLGRETFLAPVSWDNDGWPHVNNDLPIELVMECKGEGNRTSDNLSLSFSPESPHFIFRRNPQEDTLKIVDKSLFLKLDSGVLGDLDHRSFLGIRQKHFQFIASTSLKFSPAIGDEAGICVIMSDNQHYRFAIKNVNSKFVVSLDKTIGDIFYTGKGIPTNAITNNLIIEADKDFYYFYTESNGKKEFVGKGMTQLLSAETGSTFNGVCIGMFASGSGIGYAEFLQFNYTGADIRI